MKRALTAAVLFAVLLTSCSENAKTSAIDGLEISAIYETVCKDVELPASETTELTQDNFAYYMFIDPIEGAEGVGGDAMMSAIAHSVCLLRVPEGTDVKATADAIKEKADPRKWICVEAAKVTVSTNGNVILLVMSTEEIADAVAANFEKI